MRKSQEIRNRIVVADIFHHLFQKLQVRRVLPVFHPVSDLIAENPAEIFVAREGEEAAGVCSSYHCFTGLFTERKKK